MSCKTPKERDIKTTKRLKMTIKSRFQSGGGLAPILKGWGGLLHIRAQGPIVAWPPVSCNLMKRNFI